MRWIVAVVVVAAGCLDIPSPPGSGERHLLRDQHLVMDLDGDGLADLVTWGSDEVEGQGSIQIRYGSPTGLPPVPDLVLAPQFNVNAAWYEVLDVDLLDLDGDFQDLIVVWGEDATARVPDQTTPVDRTLYVGYFLHNPNAPNERGYLPVVHSAPITGELAQRGGYADSPDPIYVVARVRDNTPPVNQIILGTRTELYFFDVDTAFSTIATTSLTREPGDCGAVIDAVRSDEPSTSSDVVFATAAYAYRTVGDPDPTGSPWATFGRDLGTATETRTLTFADNIDGRDFALITDETNRLAVVQSPMTYNPNPLDVFELGLATHPYGVAMQELDNPSISIVAIDDVATGTGRQLEAFLELQIGAPGDPIGIGSVTSFPVDPAYTSVAIDKFDARPVTIYALSADPGYAPRCFVVAGGFLGDCP